MTDQELDAARATFNRVVGEAMVLRAERDEAFLLLVKLARNQALTPEELFVVKAAAGLA